MSGQYTDPSVNEEGYEAWLTANGLETYGGWPFSNPDYIPDDILNTYFLEGIEEQKDSNGLFNQTYKATWETLNKEYGKCDDGSLWKNGAPSWGPERCEVLEDKIYQTATDSATEFVLKTCRFKPYDFSAKRYAQVDGHMTPSELTQLCSIGKSFMKEIQNNTRSLAYMNSNFDSDPSTSKTGLQSPLLLLYGQNRIDTDKVMYPIISADLASDQETYSDTQCKASISARDEEVRTQSEKVRNDIVNRSSNESDKRNSLTTAETKIKEANRKVALACFPNYNKTTDSKTSLKLDTIAGNIFQIATLPVSEYEELKEWRDMNDTNKDAFDKKGLAAFSDSRCRNARSIGYHLCRNLPSSVITRQDFENLHRSCGYSKPPADFRLDESDGIMNRLRQLNSGWYNFIERQIDELEPNRARHTDACEKAKAPLKASLKAVRDRISNPALGSVDDPCGNLKLPMACGEFTQGIDLPAVPQFEDSPETKIRTFVYNSLLGGTNSNFNCSNFETKKFNEDRIEDRIFAHACTLIGSSTDRSELKGLLRDQMLQQKLADAYKFSLNEGDFSTDCKRLSSEDSRRECHIISKIVPEVCESKETARLVCESFSQR